MKLIPILLLLITSYVHAQVPSTKVSRDSLPLIPGPCKMPNAQPNNSFYRAPGDPDNVVRATLDNMPVKVPDSSQRYTIQQMPGPYKKQVRPNLPVLPTPKITPSPK